MIWLKICIINNLILYIMDRRNEFYLAQLHLDSLRTNYLSAKQHYHRSMVFTYMFILIVFRNVYFNAEWSKDGLYVIITFGPINFGYRIFFNDYDNTIFLDPARKKFQWG